MIKKHIILVLIFLSIINSYGQNHKYEKHIKHIMNTLNCERSYANWVISRIDNFSVKIQSNIEYIANSNDNYQTKINSIPNIISQNFVSNNSKIDVSSKNRKSLTTYTIREYLFHLAKIKKRYGYAKVELIFIPDYLGMGKFYKISDNTYELSITMWQVFKSWFRDSNIAYEDATRKKFRLIFYVNSRNELTNIKVDRVFVSETIDVNKIKIRWNE